MRPNPWAFVALVVLTLQVSPLVWTLSAQSGNVVLPHHVQGSGATSPLAGNTLTVRAVVAAEATDGFFIQTEGLGDGDANTSEGLFVQAPLEFGVGTIVLVTGTVEEFGAAGQGTVTRLVNVTLVTPAGTASEPDPIPLTNVELSPDGSSDQLERFEGMRVTVASLRSVSGTSLDGSFYAVLHDPASPDAVRPFRGPGIEVGAPALACALDPSVGPCAFESFDGNPERLRVDSDGLAGTMAVHLSAGAVMSEVAGQLHFDVGAYTLLPQFTLAASGGTAVRTARAAGATEFSIASLSLGNAPVDDEIRLIKASLIVRTVLNAPDVIGVQQADAALLAALAAQIDMDASEADEAAPGYVAHHHGFLVKASRVSVASAEVLGADEVFAGGLLFERAPVMLRGVVTGGPADVQALTVLNVELRSNAGVAGADDAGANARAHRLAQAVRVAEFVRDRNDANDALVVVGNFNAHAFNDGYVDVTGTVSGAPALPDAVVLQSPDLVTPDLANLAVGLLNGERYSSVERGNAQSLDHTLVSANLAAQVTDFAYARVNADFQELLQFFEDNPGRLSDRDPSVAYFRFAADVTAPEFDWTPEDVFVDATGSSGATVNYAVPTATDNVDGAVAVTCEPASGSVFPLGPTVVTCSAEDTAGNQSELSFLVTVEDDDAPLLFVPANITEEADTAAGRVVAYSVTATDGTSVPTVVCQPASGSLFPIGTTTVNCEASDDSGNTSSASFTVTITASSAAGGRMYGAGLVRSGHKRAAFAFEVKQSSRSAERGWLVLTVNDGHGRPDWSCVAGVFEVRFSNPRGTVSFSGTGNWNGKRGYRFDVTATDGGGRGRDKFAVVVKAPNGQVVLSMSGVVSLGTIKQTR